MSKHTIEFMYKIGDVVELRGKKWTVGYIVVTEDGPEYSLDPVEPYVSTSTFGESMLVEEDELFREATKLAKLL